MLTEIARAPENSNFAWLIISRDGQRLAFNEWRGEKEPCRLMVMPAQGGEMTEILGCPDNVMWSPDGKKLLFTKQIENAGADPRNELWVRSVEGGEQKSTGVLMGIHLLSLHPDGTRISFTRVERKPEIWVMENFLPE
jgi:dipeptidyl aminopeptidase/acylaminoacyl peptidase